MPTIETRGYWGDLIKGVSAKFANVFNEAKESYSLALNDLVATPGNKMTAIFKMDSTEKARERYVTKAGLGYLTNTPEGAAFAQDARVPGYITNITPQKYTSGVTLTLEAMQDQDYQAALDEFADLTVSAQETKDKLALQLFNYGFTAAASVPPDYAIYGDAKPLFSTIHPLAGSSSTVSNASSTGLVLNEANLETARLAMQNQLDDRGKPMRVGTGKLVLLVPPALEKTAVIITKGEKRSGTANNDINIYDGLFTVVASQYISAVFSGGSDTAWYIIDPRVAKLSFVMRKDLTTSRYIDNRTKDTTFDIYGRWQVCAGDFRGLWGSKGDAVAYSS